MNQHVPQVYYPREPASRACPFNRCLKPLSKLDLSSLAGSVFGLTVSDSTLLGIIVLAAG